MSSPPTIEPFKGINWEECNQFVRAIRAAAWKESKLQDLAWIAGFASLHFSHQALLWHSQLPQDIRQDWAKLEVALLTQWKPLTYGDEPPIEPRPAAALSPNLSGRADRPLQGVLKVVINGSNTDYYFKTDELGSGMLTNSANEAIPVRCGTLFNTTILERIDGSRHFWLGVQWEARKPNLEIGSTDYGYLVFVNPFRATTSRRADQPHQLASFTISADGEVIPLCENEDTTRITLGIFSSYGFLSLVADPSKVHSDMRRARIFIKPID